jgi:hypothetical protein
LITCIGLALTLALACIAPQPAAARIKCNGPFQIIKGIGEHASNYCEDGYLAAIAREFGWKVGDDELRDSPGLKHRICMQIGHDARLIGICANHRPESGRQGFSF